MSAAAFDTLSAAHDLEAAGFERRQAEAIAKVVNHGDERAATKDDVDNLETRINAAFAGIRSELATIRWVIGLLAAFVFTIGLRIFGLL